MDYSQIPAGATLEVKPFTAHAPEEKLQHLKQLLALSPIAPACFENTNCGQRFGITRDWLENAKKAWLNDFDWRKHEDRINSYPNFKATVDDAAGDSTEVHFMALFSEKEDAVPVAFFHGWPSTFCEYMDILDLLKQRYTPADLPYHVVVPSLPGYAYSSGPPLDKDYGVDIVAGAMNNLMVGLGFGSGYLAQGGDLGSFVSRALALGYDSCKGMHVTLIPMPPKAERNEATTEEEIKVVRQAAEFIDTDFGFALQDGSRAATVGLALSASPLALLAWIGEKMLAWTDEDPPVDEILQEVTLYWLTDTISRALYHHRAMGHRDESPKIARLSSIASQSHLKIPYVGKPCGYSQFAGEIIPVPKHWAAKSINIVSFSKHEKGGHFAAREKPKELLADVEEFIRVAWKVEK